MVWHRFFSQAVAEALKVKNIDLSWNRIGNEGAEACLHFVALHSDMSRWISAEKDLGGGFNYFFIFTPIRGRFPIWLIFFRWVQTTNQIQYCLYNTCMEYFSSFTSCRLHPLSPTSVLLPSHVRDSWKIWPSSWTGKDEKDFGKRVQQH